MTSQPDQQQPAQQRGRCAEPPGHMGWLDCPVHSREAREIVAWMTSPDPSAHGQEMNQLDPETRRIMADEQASLAAGHWDTDARGQESGGGEVEQELGPDWRTKTAREVVTLRAEVERLREENARVVEAAREASFRLARGEARDPIIALLDQALTSALDNSTATAREGEGS